LNLAPPFPIRQKSQRLEELEEEEGRTARQDEVSKLWRLRGKGVGRVNPNWAGP
jgi:hypothetical protein